MREGVRDDFKTMTGIYGRLCSYLDRAASNPPQQGTGEPTTAAPVTAANDDDGDGNDGLACGAISDASAPPAVSTSPSQDGALSVFVAAALPPPPAGVPEIGTGEGGGEGDRGGAVVGEVELEGVMNDLEVKRIVVAVDS